MNNYINYFGIAIFSRSATAPSTTPTDSDRLRQRRLRQQRPCSNGADDSDSDDSDSDGASDADSDDSDSDGASDADSDGADDSPPNPTIVRATPLHHQVAAGLTQTTATTALVRQFPTPPRKSCDGAPNTPTTSCVPAASPSSGNPAVPRKRKPKASVDERPLEPPAPAPSTIHARGTAPTGHRKAPPAGIRGRLCFCVRRRLLLRLRCPPAGTCAPARTTMRCLASASPRANLTTTPPTTTTVRRSSKPPPSLPLALVSLVLPQTPDPISDPTPTRR